MIQNRLTPEFKKALNYGVKPCFEKSFAIKDVDTVGRVVTGFYNTYDFFDSDNDVLVMGAAKKTIKERGPNSSATAKIKHALDHDLKRLPGSIRVLDEREYKGMTGIYFETKMADTTIGNDTLKNYLEGIYDNHSIGFQYMQVEMFEAGAKGWDKAIANLINAADAIAAGILFLVKEVALFEGSTVAFGANKLTPFLGVKSGNKDAMKIALFEKINQLESALTKGTQSDDMMNVFEIQVLQLKQMITELTESIPSQKSTLLEPLKKDNLEVVKAIDYNFLTNNFKI